MGISCGKTQGVQQGSNLGCWCHVGYGEYPELCGLLHKYIKGKDVVLVVGCGNSSLSADLFDVGYRNITNIDISPVVVRQMTELHLKTRPTMVFQQMDALDMSFPNEQFSVVLDKGTLDALMSDTSPETDRKINKLFSEIDRVLRVGGRYVCVSLLQSHILLKLLEFFPSAGWMLRVCRCEEAEQKTAQAGEGAGLPVFLVVCTKFKKLPNMRPWFLDSPEGTVAGHGEVNLDLYRPTEESPRYTVHVLDQANTRLTGRKYAAFIVPQGREMEWLFSTPEGRVTLQKSTGFDRLAVVSLHRNQEYKDLEAVQEELNDSILHLAPPGLGKNPTIPFLSVGSDVGRREVCYRGHSPISGDFIVEEVERDGGNLFRRLVFLDNQNVVQSEARLKLCRHIQQPCNEDVGVSEMVWTCNEDGGGEDAEENDGNKVCRKKDRKKAVVGGADNRKCSSKRRRIEEDGVKSRKGKPRKVVDVGFLACEHHTYMTVGVAMAAPEGAECSVAVIGLGGGGLCMFLQHCFHKVPLYCRLLRCRGVSMGCSAGHVLVHSLGPNGPTSRDVEGKIRVTAVDIDPTILEVATEYFNLVQDERLEVYIRDGLHFIKQAAEKVFYVSGTTFEAVLFDVDNKSPSSAISCPPAQFLEEDLLRQVKTLIGDQGTVQLGVVVWSEQPQFRATTVLCGQLEQPQCYVVSYNNRSVVWSVRATTVLCGQLEQPQCWVYYSCTNTNYCAITGVFVLNLVCRMDQVRSNIISTLSSIFGSVCSYKLEQEVNEIVFCTNQGPLDQQQWRLMVEEAATKVNSLVKKKKLQSLDLVTTETFVGSLNVPV
uniref:Methyltransferase type 11 domain-containing protein n=1 Tax=Timema cristinae TaxID=61476 RepID=A0A7R9D8A2_TIMCR|nr:unnamed protein product [Timema cristinae]